jgi:hypothetical protein
MSRERKRARRKGIESLEIGQLARLITGLKEQLNATKKLYFSHQGVVNSCRTIPDHATRFRALVELTKLHGLYPKRGERYDRSERPVLNLVIHGTDREADSQ